MFVIITYIVIAKKKQTPAFTPIHVAHVTKLKQCDYENYIFVHFGMLLGDDVSCFA